MQPVCPSAIWNEPGAHLTHVVALVCALYVPGAHGVGASEPTEQNVPSGQITHCSTLVIGRLSRRSVALAWVPPGHGTGAAAPSSQ